MSLVSLGIIKFHIVKALGFTRETSVTVGEIIVLNCIHIQMLLKDSVSIQTIIYFILALASGDI